jgi:hypothetical protein
MMLKAVAFAIILLSSTSVFAISYDQDSSRDWSDALTQTIERSKRMDSFLVAYESGRKSDAADLCLFPLMVITRKKGGFTIADKRELLARWDEIFTPRMKAHLKKHRFNKQRLDGIKPLIHTAEGSVKFTEEGYVLQLVEPEYKPGEKRK